MTQYTELLPVAGGSHVQHTDRLRLAAAAYLARYKGTSRIHVESDLRIYFGWCAEHGLDPLAAQRPHLELFVRWMQEVRGGVLEHSPAEHVRRPAVPAESPTLGFTHLQFEALLTAARASANRYDFALIPALGLLGLRIFEATAADIEDVGEEHRHRVPRVCGKGGKVVLVPLPPAVDRAAEDRATGPVLLNTLGARMDRHAATRRLRRIAEAAGARILPAHPQMLKHTGRDHARRWSGSS